MSLTALVVDDSMLIRHMVCRFLEERGFQVESAANGVEALEMIARSRPSIIITDLQMPLMTGTELITELKARDHTAAIPIVILSNKRTAADAHEEHRAQFVIYKDIDIEDQLANAIAALSREPAKSDDPITR